MNTSARHPVGVQPAEERIHNFDEVSLGYDHATMLEEADRCLHCAAAPCRKGWGEGGRKRLILLGVCGTIYSE